jgi:hypothetical protein
LHLVALLQRNLFKTDVGTDEVHELVGRDFTETFESGDLRFGRKSLMARWRSSSV